METELQLLIHQINANLRSPVSRESIRAFFRLVNREHAQAVDWASTDQEDAFGGLMDLIGLFVAADFGVFRNALKTCTDWESTRTINVGARRETCFNVPIPATTSPGFSLEDCLAADMVTETINAYAARIP